MLSRHSHLRRLLAGALALYGAFAWPGSARADVFTNNDGIVITDSSGAPQPATPYPSPIAVSGMTGNITSVKVTLTGVTHPGPQDMDILLVSPTGQTVILMSDNGGVSAISGVNLTFDDAATNSLPDNTGAIASGTFKPSNFDDGDPAGGDAFPAPAPAGPYGAALAALNGNAANGTWNLYVIDDAANQAGTITGWSLDITTDGGAAPTGKLLVTGPGPGGGPHVRLFLLDTAGNVNPLGPGFMAYDPAFGGGVNVAVADLDGDSQPEIITAPQGGGGPHVRIFKLDRTTGAVTPLGSGFMAYDPTFTGGVRVTTVDTDGDGLPEIITAPGPGGGPHVRVFKIDATGGAVAIGPEFFAYDAGFGGGVTVGAE